MFKVSACEDALVLVKIGKLLLYLVELWVVMGSIQWRALAILTEGNWLWDSCQSRGRIHCIFGSVCLVDLGDFIWMRFAELVNIKFKTNYEWKNKKVVLMSELAVFFSEHQVTSNQDLLLRSFPLILSTK